MDATRRGRPWELSCIVAALICSATAGAAYAQTGAAYGQAGAAYGQAGAEAQTGNTGPQIGGQLMTRVASSDNVALAPKGLAESESILQVAAGINFSTAAPRLDARVRSEVDGVAYDKERASNEVFGTLDASTQVALVLQRLFFDTFAVYDQTIVDPTGKGSFNRLALTGNRTDVAVLGVGPRLALNVGDNVTGEARYNDTRVAYADPSLADLNERSAIFTIGNFNNRRGGTWSVNYDSEEFDYDLAGPVAFKTFDTQLGFWATETFRLFTTQGLESDYQAVHDYSVSPTGKRPGLDDYYWYAGVEWRPSIRTTAVVSVGEHQFGRAYQLDFSYRRGHEGIVLTYNEQPTSFLRDQLLSASLTGQVSPIDTPDGPKGNPYYLQKRASLIFLLDRKSSHWALRFYSEQRYDILAAANDMQVKTEDYRAVELSLGWDITPRSFLRVSSQIADRLSTLNVVNDRLTYTVLTWGHQVGRQGELTANVSQERGIPYTGNTSVNNYEEHQIYVSLSRRFGHLNATAVPQRFNGFLNGPTARY
jgi:uncharacterized protein (PEP-CTERM system associated)